MIVEYCYRKKDGCLSETYRCETDDLKNMLRNKTFRSNVEWVEVWKANYDDYCTYRYEIESSSWCKIGLMKRA